MSVVDAVVDLVVGKRCLVAVVAVYLFVVDVMSVVDEVADVVVEKRCLVAVVAV